MYIMCSVCFRSTSRPENTGQQLVLPAPTILQIGISISTLIPPCAYCYHALCHSCLLSLNYDKFSQSHSAQRSRSSSHSISVCPLTPELTPKLLVWPVLIFLCVYLLIRCQLWLMNCPTSWQNLHWAQRREYKAESNRQQAPAGHNLPPNAHRPWERRNTHHHMMKMARKSLEDVETKCL